MSKVQSFLARLILVSNSPTNYLLEGLASYALEGLVTGQAAVILVVLRTADAELTSGSSGCPDLQQLQANHVALHMGNRFGLAM